MVAGSALQCGRHRGAAHAAARQQSPTAFWSTTYGLADFSGVLAMLIALECWTGGLGLTIMQDDVMNDDASSPAHAR